MACCWFVGLVFNSTKVGLKRLLFNSTNFTFSSEVSLKIAVEKDP